MNLDNVASISIKKKSDGHYVAAFIPGLAVDAEGSEHWDEVVLEKADEPSCKAYMARLSALISARGV